MLDTITDYGLITLAIVAIFSALVFVHEWGHYIIARLCGVRVVAFSIGFGPELFGWCDRSGTRWKVCAVPLGGYVKMFGDLDAASTGKDKSLSEEDLKGAFYAKPLWRRAVIIAAGPLVNYLFAFILLAGLYVTVGKTDIPPVAGGIVAGSVAQTLGIEPGDAVVAIDGVPMRTFDDIRRVMMLARGEEKSLVVKRGDKVLALTAAPQIEKREDHLGFSANGARLGLMGVNNGVKMNEIVSVDGVALEGTKAQEALCAKLGQTVSFRTKKEKDTFIIRPPVEANPGCISAKILRVADKQISEPIALSVFSALGAAGARVWEVNATILASFGQIFTGTRSPTELGGVVRIGAVIGDMMEGGLPALLGLTALLSITLGLINLFPIPVLDGGHLLFYLIEAILGRPVPEKIQDWAFQAGFIFLIGVMVFTNLNDIVQLIF